jgi:putative Mn2+ efflux pump MntP
VLALFLVAASVGMSNLAASIAIGVSGVDARTRLRVGLIFGAFEAGMPVLGLLIGEQTAASLGHAARWVGAGLLTAVGLYALASAARAGRPAQADESWDVQAHGPASGQAHENNAPVRGQAQAHAQVRGAAQESVQVQAEGPAQVRGAAQESVQVQAEGPAQVQGQAQAHAHFRGQGWGEPGHQGDASSGTGPTAAQNSGSTGQVQPPRIIHLLVSGLALSLDNLVVGFALGTYHTSIALGVIVIGAVSVVMSLIGLELGASIGNWAGRRGEQLAGVMLISVGIAIASGALS